MKVHFYMIYTFLICTFLTLWTCGDSDKWELKGRKFEKEESFNYSEYISGELDSTAKTELEQSRQIAKDKKDEIVQQVKQETPPKMPDSPPISKKIWKGVKGLYNDFIDFLKNFWD